MRKVAFDTLAYTQILIKAGMENKLAEAHTEALSGAFTNAYDNLASKSDIKDVRSEIKNVKNQIKLLQYKLTLRLGTLMATGISVIVGLMTFFHFH